MAVADELDPASVCHLFENKLFTVGSSESKSLCCFFFKANPHLPLILREIENLSCFKLMSSEEGTQWHLCTCIFVILEVHTHFLYF